MMDLSKPQLELFNELVDTIKTAKESNNLKEFYVNSRMRYIGERQDYEEIKKHEKNRFDKLSDDEIKFYIKVYEMGKNNMVRTYANSNTIRALEKKGYIEIIFDAANSNSIDKIKVLKGVD
ncbi:MAG: hypothetical protein IJF92_00035 [Bacilli bacterium]|nr:hypothetical protein [Bacilli bacterium]MBQ3307622.1 hypothetical protein [Bacilli bacterium]MBQ3422992.1 hypothetical protein [Romboutsia sp.]